MKKIYQAKLPKGAYTKDFEEVTGGYKHKSDQVGFNKWDGKTKTPVWSITQYQGIGETVWSYIVKCPKCGEVVLKYKDGQKLKPRVVEHCGLKDTFYIGEEL